jgi:hypothetical protein
MESECIRLLWVGRRKRGREWRGRRKSPGKEKKGQKGKL